MGKINFKIIIILLLLIVFSFLLFSGYINYEPLSNMTDVYGQNGIAKNGYDATGSPIITFDTSGNPIVGYNADGSPKYGKKNTAKTNIPTLAPVGNIIGFNSDGTPIYDNDSIISSSSGILNGAVLADKNGAYPGRYIWNKDSYGKCPGGFITRDNNLCTNICEEGYNDGTTCKSTQYNPVNIFPSSNKIPHNAFSISDMEQIITFSNEVALNPSLNRCNLFGTSSEPITPTLVSAAQTSFSAANPHLTNAFPSLQTALISAEPSLQKAYSDALPYLQQAYKDASPSLMLAYQAARPSLMQAYDSASPSIKQAAPSLQNAYESALPSLQSAYQSVSPSLQKLSVELPKSTLH